MQATILKSMNTVPEADVKSEEVKKKVFEKSAGKCSKKSAEKSAKWLINVMIR